jgi:hypothetical protein
MFGLGHGSGRGRLATAGASLKLTGSKNNNAERAEEPVWKPYRRFVVADGRG